MPKPEKITAVAEMKKLFDEADSFFVTDYQGLNVAAVTTLRSNLRKQNVKFVVAKNTLLKLAAHQAGIEGIDPFLNGPTAIAFCEDDPVATAKVLQDMFKEKELPRTKVFVVADRVYQAENLKAFSELPSREQLLSQVAAAVQAPLTELVGTIDGFFHKLMGSVDALADKRKTEA
jgi:large subunit ribosomal protein L10